MNLYEEQLMNHFKQPVNWGRLDSGNEVCVVENNPLCGDEVLFYAEIQDYKVVCRYEVNGCMICKASGSVACSYLSNHTVIESSSRVKAGLNFLGDLDMERIDIPAELSPLQAILPYRARLKCAQLPWIAAQKALQRIL
ncbi:MAG: hypothetical protein CMP10_09950 [Zetaproteobacteria bacterium]|nr:hypothetical protein [Pseudobdellovibrionaceae bacterium]